MKTRYYIEGQELLILRKHIEVCLSQDLSPFHFDFLTFIYISISVFIFSIFSSWLPTKYISELHPNKVLKYL